ncbi:MAG: hypothetical protein ACRDVM_06730 [Acidimicrobiia bacterium]
MSGHPICATCGVQYQVPPDACKICADERQYLGWGGQVWTTLSSMREEGYRNRIEEEELGLWGIGTEPTFCIGQRALLVVTRVGNVLWDCISYLDDETVARVDELGGVAAISASHPHFYGSMVEWSDAFDGAPIWLPEADREWVCRPDPAYRFYRDRAEPVPGVTLIRCGGHFPGSAVLHWPEGAEGKGALLTSDTITVAMDRRFVSFMWSYPNSLPLDAGSVKAVVASVEPVAFDRLHGGWWGRTIPSGGKAAVRASLERYLRRIGAQA